MSEDLKAVQAAACAFVAANLSECCADEIDWQETGILRNGKLREAANLFARLDHHRSIPMAQNETKRLAMLAVIATKDAPALEAVSDEQAQRKACGEWFNALPVDTKYRFSQDGSGWPIDPSEKMALAWLEATRRATAKQEAAPLAGQQAGARTETEINEVLEACSELIDNQNDPWDGLKTYAEGVLNGIDWALGHVDTHPIYEPASKESAS